MKLIAISNGLFTKVDDDDFDSLNQYKWNGSKKYNSKNIGYYVHRSECVGGKTKHVGMMHRIILNATKGQEVDHIDGDGLNNQKSNLRFCTHGQNQQNRTFNRTNKSVYKYKGIYLDRGKIRAEICSNGKKYRLGYFKTEKDAAIAYNNAAKKLHGEFANINTIID